MRFYYLIIIIISFFLGWEYFTLTEYPQLSFLIKLQKFGFLSSSYLISTKPGRSLSLFLGWSGFTLMIIMNVYSLKKRFNIFPASLKISTLLDFHIFCGLLGPLLILFHSHFKARGIVAISFWSMIISALSGVIGRYFYLQMSSKEIEFAETSKKIEIKLKQYLERKKIDVSDEERVKALKSALSFSGGFTNNNVPNPFIVLLTSIMGDIRLMFHQPTTPENWPSRTQFILKDYSLNLRRAQFFGSFQKLTGYWHTFHLPFAIFMHAAAVIHVVAALILGIKN